MASIINATTTNGVAVQGDNSGSLQLQTNNGTTAVTIDTSQNVGIGTTSPATKLTVASGGKGRFYRADNTRYGDIYTDNDALKIESSTDPIVINAATGQGTRFQDAGTERMRITGGGNLEFASGAGYLQLATNQTMRVPSTGGIGYVGNINSATVFQIAYNSTSSGVQLSSGATSWGTFSDSRLKNITGTYTNALNDIAQIQPVKFTWKSDENSKPQVGVIAQSVENVVPEAIDSTTIEMDGTEKYLTVRYTELIPLMIASIQELKAELDATKAEVQALKGVA